jgi:ureidoglycolate lyase
MAAPLILDISGLDIRVTATPLERSAFAQFGDVIENPNPELHPSAFSASASASASVPASAPARALFDAVSANQGTAIKYQNVTRMVNLYGDAPSGRSGAAVTSMFVCAARALGPDGTFPVRILERHPYTTQTFTPLGQAGRYLVIVAPSLPPGLADAGLPVPSEDSDATQSAGVSLPGRGVPDVRRLRAFVATAGQAVTYGAGTWHAPMVALGKPGATVDFVVVQFANGVGIEDCQEVVLTTTELTGSHSAGRPGQVLVRIPEDAIVARL